MNDGIFTSHEIVVYKRRFNSQLEPYKIMLKDKKHKMPFNEWLGEVEKTKRSILQSPDQYLETDDVPKVLFATLVNKIFEDYLREESR